MDVWDSIGQDSSAANMHYPFKKEKNDSKDNSEISRAITPTTGPEGIDLKMDTSLLPPQMQQARLPLMMPSDRVRPLLKIPEAMPPHRVTRI